MSDVSNLLDIWGAAMWRASWQGGLFALVVWCVCLLVPSLPARFQCWLWRLVMLKFLVSLLLSVPIELTLLPAADPVAWTATEQVMFNPLPLDGASAVPQESVRFVSPFSLIFVAWVGVVLWQLGRICAACRQACWLRSGCRASEDRDLLEPLGRFSKLVGLATPPRLLQSDGSGSPLLVGILRPAIVLPTTTLKQLDTAERELVIGHEIAHVKRRDLLSGLLAAVIRALFFFHPLVWLSERQLRLTQEIAADELAIALQKQHPASYASLLVSIVSKLECGPLVPTMSVGAAGSQSSLQQRLSAMRFMKPVSPRIVIAYGVALGLFAALGLLPWTVVAAQAPTVDKVEPKKTVDQKEKNGFGRFVSFKDGTLTLENNAGVLLVWNKLAESKNTVKFNPEANEYKPVVGFADALQRVTPGTFVQVGDKSAYVRIGARIDSVVGTFVSFKDGRLLMLGTNLPESFLKRYGNSLHHSRFRDDVPAYESIDGGEYRLIGTANKILGDVKEGTFLTIHGEGDDNVTMVQIGVVKK